MPMTLEIDDDTQHNLIIAASRAVGLINALVEMKAINSELQCASAQLIAFDIQAAVTAAIKAQKVAA